VSALDITYDGLVGVTAG